jgi:hypothetical protein
MIEHVKAYWWLYWGIAASTGLFWFLFRQTDKTKPRAERIRSLLAGHRHSDRDSPSHDPGLFGRQIFLLAIGLPLIGLALLLVWLLGV